MATLTNEQIEQKKQLLAEKVKEMKAIYKELLEAGAIELSEEELDGVAGGGAAFDWVEWWQKYGVKEEDLSYLLDEDKTGESNRFF